MALYIGLISGTSVDAVDAVLCDISQAPTIKQIHSLSHNYPTELRQQLLDFGKSQYNGDPIDQLGQLDHQVAIQFAEAVNRLLVQAGYRKEDIRGIGSHGQTLRHRPELKFPFTLQVGDPSLIASKTQITTIADFRRKDMALGGQGAPFAPAFHHHFFSDVKQNRAIVNLGGIANVTLLQPGKPPIGFDTGPANTLMDQWISQHKKLDYDANGQWANGGHILPELLDALKKDPYFLQQAPKSTGCEYFNMDWLKTQTQQFKLNHFAPQDVQRTLLQLTVDTVNQAIKQYLQEGEVYLCGGGAHNNLLHQEIQKQIPNIPVNTTQALGVSPDWVEALTFAWFAAKTLNKETIDLCSITGAAKASILGGIYHP